MSSQVLEGDCRELMKGLGEMESGKILARFYSMKTLVFKFRSVIEKVTSPCHKAEIANPVVCSVSVNMVEDKSFLNWPIMTFPDYYCVKFPYIGFCCFDESMNIVTILTFSDSHSTNKRFISCYHSWFEFRVRRKMDTLQSLVPGFMTFLKSSCIRLASCGKFIADHLSALVLFGANWITASLLVVYPAWNNGEFFKADRADYLNPYLFHIPIIPQPVVVVKWYYRERQGICGSTGCAVVAEGFRFVGMELDPEYVEIARRRVEHWATMGHQIDLFEGG